MKPVADHRPVVNVQFSRELPHVINRLHSLLDAQRAVIRCYPLPDTKASKQREEDDGEEELGMEHFVVSRFADREDLQVPALDLLHRGDSDADGIVSAFIEKRLEEEAVREED